jgi:hypothetical protein
VLGDVVERVGVQRFVRRVWFVEREAQRFIRCRVLLNILVLALDEITQWVILLIKGRQSGRTKPRSKEMTYKNENGEIFGRIDENGNVVVLYAEDGSAVTSIDENVYPVDSSLSARYEHAEGLVLTREDADSLGIEIE